MIEINVSLLNELKLSPDEYVYLYCKARKCQLPESISLNERFLEKEGYIKITDTEIILRNKGIKLFQQQVDATNVAAWIDEWRALFPKGVKTGGYLVRGDRPECLKKMKAFMKEHSYTKEEIMGATQTYVDVKRVDRWAYMMRANLFIKHNDKGSALAAYCEDYIDKHEEQIEERYGEEFK